jgi:hypothetical protein
MAHPDFVEIARRPVRYWNVDGLPELVMGCLWALWGGAWLVGETLPRDWRRDIYWTAAPALLVFTGWAAVWIIKWLKARLTFPRTGYVEWKEPSRGANLGSAAVALITAAVLAGFVVRNDAGGGRFAAPVLGVILSLAFVVASVTQRAPHYLALAAVAATLGLALATIEGDWLTANWLFIGVGAATALVGAVRLTRFIRKHPRPAMEGA